MDKTETKLRFTLLIDISSTGSCIKSNLELALELNTTIPYVEVILRQMELKREIHMASSQGGRMITYPKKPTNSLW